MSTRHEARALVLQTLFELDVKDLLTLSDKESEAILTRNKKELYPNLHDDQFSTKLVRNVLSRRITLDDIIVRAAPDWPLEKIDILDRNILRIGLVELLFSDRGDTPPKVAIDEAIELGKEFGGEASGKFVNGVLGAVYKEMGEPQKAESGTAAPKKKTPKEELAGAVVFTVSEGKVLLALVHDVFGYWTLSKTKLEEGERHEEAVKRCVKGELGLPNVECKEVIGENQYIANKPEQGKVVKHVVYSLVSAPYSTLTLEKSGGLDQAKWVPYEELSQVKMYGEIRALVEKAVAQIAV